MMIQVLFFAQIRETIGISSLELDVVPETIADLLELLSAKNDKWHMALKARTVLCSANKVLVNQTYQIKEGDEIAFFPPVTGG